MTQTPPDIPTELETAFFEQLKNGQPIQEYALLKALTEQGFQGFKPSLDSLELFRSHFLCFHLLYRLQADWFSQGKGWLEIYTLNIQLHPVTSKQSSALTLPDSLRDYYLDYQHFLDTQVADVQSLLDDFWSQFSTNSFASSAQLNQALQQLELQDCVLEQLTLTQVNQQYRKLSAVHHPDKGGETEKFQTISAAANLLRKHCQA